MNRTLQKSLFAIVIILLFVSGCADTGDRGTLRRDRELGQMFMSYQVMPEHNYFTSGGYDKPNAILGIHKDYEMVTEANWRIIPNVSSAQVEKWIRTIDPEDRGPGHDYFAYYILDPEGKRVGFWYSIQRHTVVKFLEGNKIEVYPPELIQPGDGFGDGDGRGRRIMF